MNVPQEQLDAWARFAERARGTGLRLWAPAAVAGRPEAEELRSLADAAADALVSMEQAGANLPAHLLPADAVPLEKLDTPANRNLLRALGAAYDAALAVDHERGYGNDGPAQLLAEWMEQTRLEVYGPKGHGEG